MKIQKLHISEKKFDLNLKFYFWLKHLVKTKLTESQALAVLEIAARALSYQEAVDALHHYTENKIKGAGKAEHFFQVVEIINSKTDLDVFLFSLRLYLIKDLLLAEAKLKEIVNKEELAKLDPLSLAYDKKSLYSPYSTRVNGALLALLFFDNLDAGKTNLISREAHQIVTSLSAQAKRLAPLGLEPNQIFMLMFSESINQSIISDSGSNYEDRIMSVLLKIGIPQKNISKLHDGDDKSTEFDFFFELNGRTFGLGAKRTLRERYKQFIKTALTSKIDVFIEITLGLDLNEEKAKTIISHGTIIFVADEVYESRPFLKKLNGVYPVKSLTIATLKSLLV